MNRIIGIAVASLAFLILACGQAGQAGHPHRGAAPVRLQIPRLHVDASVEQVGADQGGRMAIPSDYRDVAWYAPGVVPGDRGDAVIDGHLDWVVGGRLTPAVFTDLGSLRTGDEVDVMSRDGRTLRFKVTDSRALAYNANPAQAGIFATGGTPRLTLITCTGTFDGSLHQYNQRRAVTAELVNG